MHYYRASCTMVLVGLAKIELISSRNSFGIFRKRFVGRIPCTDSETQATLLTTVLARSIYFNRFWGQTLKH
jgi:hypothetical protein